MSRSRKKTPILKFTDSGMKKVANRKIRKDKSFFGKGNSYRKIERICDSYGYLTESKAEKCLLEKVPLERLYREK